MANAWMEHVKKVRKENPKLMEKGGLKAILKLAGNTYKKSGKSHVVKKTKNHVTKKSKKSHKKSRKHK